VTDTDKKQSGAAAEVIKSERSEKFSRLYTNSAQLRVSPWDFTFAFGEIEPAGDGMKVTQHVEIVMSPQHAKALLAILANNVQEYEKQVGDIRLPQQQVPKSEPHKTPVAVGFKPQ
jgi:uncharacterized protein DUF3467